MPFVQGHLRNEPLTVTFRTECAHCAEPLRIEIDSQLRFQVADGASPLIFLPIVNFKRLKDPSIIHAF